MKDDDKRRTRIVFPSGKEATVWKIVVAILAAWAGWVSTQITDLLKSNHAMDKCRSAMVQVESLERVSK